MPEESIIVHLEKDMEELMPVFFEESENEINALNAALAGDDVPTIKAIGHRIKGSSASYGFDEMSRIGKAIEDGAAQRLSKSDLTQLVDRLAHHVRLVEIVYDG